MPILLKAIYRLNNSTKISMSFFTEIGKAILKCICVYKRPPTSKIKPEDEVKADVALLNF